MIQFAYPVWVDNRAILVVDVKNAVALIRISNTHQALQDLYLKPSSSSSLEEAKSESSEPTLLGDC